MNVGEMCTREVVCVQRDTGLVEAARQMREHHVGNLVVVADKVSPVPVGMLTIMQENGVRRLPVVSRNGTLVGIVSIDDILELFAEQMEAFTSTLRKERVRELRARA